MFKNQTEQSQSNKYTMVSSLKKLFEKRVAESETDTHGDFPSSFLPKGCKRARLGQNKRLEPQPRSLTWLQGFHSLG